jgi:hypothetical protein
VIVTAGLFAALLRFAVLERRAAWLTRSATGCASARSQGPTQAQLADLIGSAARRSTRRERRLRRLRPWSRSAGEGARMLGEELFFLSG